MTFRNVALSCLGLSIVSVTIVPRGGAQPSPTVPPISSSETSSLGGPITPTQPAFFPGSTAPPSPDALNKQINTTFSPLPPVSRRPAAPMVDDPPRPSGGFINIKTD